MPDADPKPLNMDVATEKCKSELYSIRELRDAVDDNVAMLWGRFSYLRGFFEGNIRYENSENINNKILLELSKILVYEVEIIHPYKDKWGEARKYTCTWTMKGGLEPSVREEPLS